MNGGNGGTETPVQKLLLFKFLLLLFILFKWCSSSSYSLPPPRCTPNRHLAQALGIHDALPFSIHIVLNENLCSEQALNKSQTIDSITPTTDGISSSRSPRTHAITHSPFESPAPRGHLFGTFEFYYTNPPSHNLNSIFILFFIISANKRMWSAKHKKLPSSYKKSFYSK